MMESPQRRPESILASEAEKRVSTANGRPVTRESTHLHQNNRPTSKRNNEITKHNQNHMSTGLSNQNGVTTPQNTPREFQGVSNADNNSVNGAFRSLVADNEDIFDDKNILEEDELFMTLTPEEREQWNKMMTEREQQLESNKEKYKAWSHSFTRRRMFAYSRMRKINLSYDDRVHFFANMAETFNRVVMGPKGDPKEILKGKISQDKTRDEIVVKSELANGNRNANKSLKRNETRVDVPSVRRNRCPPEDGDSTKPEDFGKEQHINTSTKVNETFNVDSVNSQMVSSSRVVTPVCKVEDIKHN